jgi:D-threonate/D-erythronate kinase
MIAVIADDLTGAAELGGIGLRFQLNVEISLDVPFSTESDLLIIATDTRSRPEREATEEIEKVTAAVSLLQPELIFKKVDSVLRGHVLAEISTQLKVLDIKQALLVPANPALGRTFVNGTCFINGEPIADTSFSFDPEFPVKQSDVLSMLRTGAENIKVLKPQQLDTENGVVVGEAESQDDLKEWASLSLGKNILLAGGAGFFTSILQSLDLNSSFNSQDDKKFKDKKLFISGTTFGKSTKLIKEIYHKDGPVKYFPDSVLNGKPESDVLDSWIAEVLALIEREGKAIIAVDPASNCEKTFDAVELREITAGLVHAMFSRSSINELIIEGGSTASAILKRLGVKLLKPVSEYSPGVIRSLSNKPNLYITLKPGSYDWPKEVWMI